MAHLLDAGVFANSVELGVERSFMPGLLEMVSQQVRQNAMDRQLLGGITQTTVDDSVATHSRVLDVERRRLKALDEAERELRKCSAEEQKKREEREKRVLREQTRMRKFDSQPPPKKKVVDFMIESFDGETMILDDGRKVTEFGDEKLKEDLQEMMANVQGGIGENVVCNLETDLEFVPPEGADPGIAWGSKITSVKKYRVNSFGLEIISAQGLRDYPCDPYVVVRDVNGLVGDERRTEVFPETMAPEWKHTVKLPCTYKLSAMVFDVLDANPDHKVDGEDALLLRCKLPVDMLYDAFKETPEGQDLIELDTWLDTEKHQKEKDGNTSQGQLRVSMRAKFNIPIMLPGKPLGLPPRFELGLAWEFISEDKPVDLDASVVGLNAAEEIVDQVWFQKLEGFGGAVIHSGDNRSGEGDGDDETIAIDLEKLPPSVEKLAICINSYDEDHLDECVSFAYLRLIAEGTTYGFFSMGEGWIPHCTGLFFGVVARTSSGAWQFVTTAVAADGSTVEQSMPAILAHGKQHLGW